MKTKLARAAVILAISGSFVAGSGAAFAGSGDSAPFNKDARTKSEAKAAKADDYKYEEPGEDGSYKLDKKQCAEALKHPEPPHQDGDRWAYWNACKDKYGSHHEPAKKHEPKYDPDHKYPTPKTKAPTVHVTPSFTG